MTRPRVKKRPRGGNLPKAEILRVLRFLTQHQAEKGMAPTARELADGLGYSSSSVAQYRLDALLERGLVVVDVGKSRSVRVTEAGRVEVAQDPAERLLALNAGDGLMTVRQFLAIPQGERPTMMDAEWLWNRIGRLRELVRRAEVIISTELEPAPAQMQPGGKLQGAALEIADWLVDARREVRPRVKEVTGATD